MATEELQGASVCDACELEELELEVFVTWLLLLVLEAEKSFSCAFAGVLL